MSDDKPEWQRARDEVEKEEEELDDNYYKSQKDAVLFAIEVSDSMLKRPSQSSDKKADKDSAMLAALKCAYQLMQQRIISNPKDMMGILLFGTEQSKFQEQDENSRGMLTYPHCYLLTDLDVPAAEDVKALRSLVEEEEGADALFSASKERVAMSNVLFCANQIFTTRAPSFGSRRLFIVTDADDPHVNDKAARSAAQVRAKDLFDLGVVIELFPISSREHDFERGRFYDDIVYKDPSDPEAGALAAEPLRSGDGITLLTSLVSSINSKQVAKRALFGNMPFELGPGLTISVKGYNILQPQKPARSCYVWLGGEKAQIAKGETEKITDDATARTVTRDEVKKAYKFGGEEVLFTLEEQAQLKYYGPAVLRIIGFKPQSMLPVWASLNKSTFIYPSEEDYVGSTRVFSALWQKLLKSNKMGVAWFIARKNAKPQSVALLPSAETLDSSTGQQLVPPGLWVYPLPSADDLRPPPETLPPLVSPDALVDAMRVVIQQLQLPGAKFDPSRYPNPALQWHYRILQAIALEEEIPEFKASDDKTLPKARQIDKRAGSYVVEWGELLEKEYNAWLRGRNSAGVKREHDPDGAASVKAKRNHVEDPNKKSALFMNTPQLKTMIASGGTAKLTVPQLKEWLTSQGLPLTGKKQDLIDRVEAAVEGM